MTDLSLTITVDDDRTPVCQIKIDPDRPLDANDLLIMAEHFTRTAQFMSHIGMVNSLSEADADDGGADDG